MRQRRRRIINQAMLAVVSASSVLVIGVMVLIVGKIAIDGAAALNVEFFTNEPVPIGQSGGGISHAIVGTLMLTGVAALVSVPLGIATGICIAEYAGGRSRLTLRFIADTLTGVPSIVIGLFVYAILVIHTGFSALAGGLALAFIMLPIIARTTEEALYTVPADQREAAAALGAPRWRVVSSVCLPSASPIIATGCLLATARASGETAPLIFTALGNNFTSTDLNEPVAAIPLLIYAYATTPYMVLHDQAWAAAFILVMVMLAVSGLTRFFVARANS